MTIYKIICNKCKGETKVNKTLFNESKDFAYIDRITDNIIYFNICGECSHI